MKTLVVFALSYLLVSTNAAAQSSELIGTWRLVSFVSLSASGEAKNFFESGAHGFISFGRDGRMFLIIAKNGRPKLRDYRTLSDEQSAELIRTVYAYAGTYTFDGKEVKYHVDISWNESWTGRDDYRDARFEGKRLILSTSEIRQTWEKVE